MPNLTDQNNYPIPDDLVRLDDDLWYTDIEISKIKSLTWYEQNGYIYISRSRLEKDGLEIAATDQKINPDEKIYYIFDVCKCYDEVLGFSAE